MNILAHLFLSGNDEEIMVGNFIADYVKGKKILKYPEGIAAGIKIHRDIDSFTDKHDLVKKTNSYFAEHYGKYSGVVTDIIFDHFLSNSWSRFSDMDFDLFVKNSYKVLNGYIRIFPWRVTEFYPFFVFNNWLKMYQSPEGIHRVLRGMSKRTSLPPEYDFAMFQLKNNYTEIDNLFIGFFNELMNFISGKYNIRFV